MEGLSAEVTHACPRVHCQQATPTVSQRVSALYWLMTDLDLYGIIYPITSLCLSLPPSLSVEEKKSTPGKTRIGEGQGASVSQTQPKSLVKEAVEGKATADKPTGSVQKERKSGKRKGRKKKARKMMEGGKSGGAENAWKPKPRPRLFRTPSEETLDELLRTKKDYTLDMLTPEKKYLLTSKLRRKRDPFQVEFEKMVIRQAAQAKMEKDRRERIEALEPRAVLEAKLKKKKKKKKKKEDEIHTWEDTNW